MDLSVQLSFRDLPPSSAVEAAISERASALANCFFEARRWRVVVDREGNSDLTGHDIVLTVAVDLPDGELVVGEHKRHPDLATALDTTFGAMAQQLEQRIVARRLFAVLQEWPEVSSPSASLPG